MYLYVYIYIYIYNMDTSEPKHLNEPQCCFSADRVSHGVPQSESRARGDSNSRLPMPTPLRKTTCSCHYVWHSHRPMLALSPLLLLLLLLRTVPPDCKETGVS